MDYKNFKINTKILSFLIICTLMFLSGVLTYYVFLNWNRFDVRHVSQQKMKEIEGLSEYIIPHERGRKCYVLTQDVKLFDRGKKNVGVLYKGSVISDASIFDLGDVDIGDNDRKIIALDIPDRSFFEELGDNNKVEVDRVYSPR